MKDSHFRTPRNMNECHWTPGYVSYKSMAYRTFKGERVADYITAIIIGIVLAGLLVAWWSS